MGYRLNRLDEPVFIAVSKPMLTEFGIHYGLESCAELYMFSSQLMAAKNIAIKPVLFLKIFPKLPEAAFKNSTCQIQSIKR